jgi:hypothetical protein
VVQQLWYHLGTCEEYKFSGSTQTNRIRANILTQVLGDSYAYYSVRSLEQVAHENSLLDIPENVTGQSVPRDA